MAKTMVHFERCNVASAEMHNSRNEQYMACVNASPKKRYSIFADQTCNNSTWIHPAYAGMTLPQLLDRYRRLYRDKIRQAPQEKDSHRLVRNKKTGMFEEQITHGWAPIRESIVPVTADTTTSDFRHFIEWMARKGVRIIRIDIHQDEGHVDPMTGERKYNRHAHVIASWIDENTATTAKLNKIDSAKMQDEIAASLGMERGVKKELTGTEHLTHDQYRAKAQAEEVKKLEKMKEEVAECLKESCLCLQSIAGDTVRQFDQLIIDGGGAVKPRKDEREHRDELLKASTDDISGQSVDVLREKTRTLRTLIRRTNKSIERIGKQLQKLSAKLPGIVLFGRKQLLAMEAEKEVAVNDAEKAKADALSREQAAKEMEKKYTDMNANAEQTLAMEVEKAKNEASQYWSRQVATAKREGRAEAAGRISELETSLEERDSTISELASAVKSREERISALQEQLQTARKLVAKYESRLQMLQQSKGRGL